MSTVKLWSNEEISAVPAVRTVFDDIRATRKSEFVNNFWRALANQPSLLERTWASVKQVMIEPGVLDPLTKELVYMAVGERTRSCPGCLRATAALPSKSALPAVLHGCICGGTRSLPRCRTCTIRASPHDGRRIAAPVRPPSPMIPPGGQRRYSFTPRPAGSRWYHSHAAAGGDLTRATYSGQFGFLYIESKTNTGSYDHEVFLAVHHWGPMLTQTGPRETCEISYRHASFNDKVLSAAEPLRVQQGQRVLFHLLNASATENVELALPRHQFHILALDGNPVPVSSAVSTISLGVAERVDAMVEMNSPGVWILGSTNESERSIGLGMPIEYAGKRGAAQWSDPAKSDWSYLLFGNQKAHPVILFLKAHFLWFFRRSSTTAPMQNGGRSTAGPFRTPLPSK